MAKEYEYKVNGIQLVSDKEILSAAEILDMAREKGAIPGKPDGYILKGTKRDYIGNDQVNLGEDDLFITVPSTSTQVA